MNINDVDKNNIELVVTICFLRVVKERGYYQIFRKQYMRKYDNLTKNEKKEITDIESLVDNLDLICDDGRIDTSAQKEQRITACINSLIHYFLENSIITKKIGDPMEVFQSLGQEVYDMASRKVFGDRFGQESARRSNLDSDGVPFDCPKKVKDLYLSYLRYENVDFHYFMTNVLPLIARRERERASFMN
jgi:hypothetical protein